MKRVVAIVILVVFILNCAPVLPQYEYDSIKGENPVVISERVGEIIDADEGKQYELFNKMSVLREVRFFAIKDVGYVVEITTAEEKLAAINRDQDVVMILRDYIDRYDVIDTARAAFENKWGILDYDTLGIPITESEVRLAIKQSRARAVKGCLTCFGGSLFFGLLGGIALATVEVSGERGHPVFLLAGAGVLVGVALIGLTVGYINYKKTYRKDFSVVVKAIKEARKPRVVE